MLNLRSVDLNPLPVFEAVYEERNVTKASDRLATVAGVSHAVARLDRWSAMNSRRWATGSPSHWQPSSCTPRVKAALMLCAKGSRNA
jgi:hypothetical protein